LGNNVVNGKFLFVTADNAYVLNDSQLIGFGVTDVEFGLEVEFNGSRVSFGRGHFFCQSSFEIPLYALAVESAERLARL
jgi:hypothetical protein